MYRLVWLSIAQPSSHSWSELCCQIIIISKFQGSSFAPKCISGKRKAHNLFDSCLLLASKFANRNNGSNLTTANLLSQNIRGYSSEQSSSKKDHIVRILRTFSDTPSILFTQETWSDKDQDLEIDNTLFFSHGAKSNTCTKGGIGIILSPLAV